MFHFKVISAQDSSVPNRNGLTVQPESIVEQGKTGGCIFHVGNMRILVDTKMLLKDEFSNLENDPNLGEHHFCSKDDLSRKIEYIITYVDQCLQQSTAPLEREKIQQDALKYYLKIKGQVEANRKGRERFKFDLAEPIGEKRFKSVLEERLSVSTDTIGLNLTCDDLLKSSCGSSNRFPGEPSFLAPILN